MVLIIFWVSLIALVYTYIGYPLLITLLAHGKKNRTPAEVASYPTVSMIMSVYNEADVIRQKIENCLAIDYPESKVEILIGSDGSTDKTGEIVTSFNDKRLQFVPGDQRHGKPHTLNKLVALAKGDVLFFTDARQIMEKDALKKLVRHFQDTAIGCVSGELVYRKEGSITGRGVDVYWRYEKHLREMESAVYSMIGATGAIYASRRSLFQPIPEDIILDDVYTPLIVVNKGCRAIFDREAVAYDIVAETPRDEHRRKIRTLSGNYQIFFRMSYMLNPFKSRIAFQMISHKLLRVIAPFFMIFLFLANLMLLGRSGYMIAFFGQVMFYATAAFEAMFRKRIKKIFGIPYLFCLLNYSALVGLWNYIFNKADVKWDKVRSGTEMREILGIDR